MIIAVDYDNTYSADPVMFEQILNVMRVKGYKVIICTMRYGAYDGKRKK